MNSAATARPSAAVTTRSRPWRLATKHARSADEQDVAGGVAVGRIGRHADGRGDRAIERIHRGAGPLGDMQHAGRRRRCGRRIGELVAAVAEDEVGIAPGAHQLLGDPPELLVAGLVAERVVDDPEVVEVEHDQAERRRHRGRGGAR